MGRTRVVNRELEPYDVYIGRPSVWGNQFYIGRDGSRKQVVKLYERWLRASPYYMAKARKELKGKVLGCWCKPEACHGDILVTICEEV